MSCVPAVHVHTCHRMKSARMSGSVEFRAPISRALPGHPPAALTCPRPGDPQRRSRQLQRDLVGAVRSVGGRGEASAFVTCRTAWFHCSMRRASHAAGPKPRAQQQEPGSRAGMGVRHVSPWRGPYPVNAGMPPSMRTGAPCMPLPPSALWPVDPVSVARDRGQLTVIVCVVMGAAPAPGNAEPIPLNITKVTV